MTSKLLLDTNVLIDYTVAKRPEHVYANEIMQRIANDSIHGYATAGSLKDFYYICRKPLGEHNCRLLIRQFLVLLTILPVGPEECRTSAYSDEPDFEDGLIRAVAEKHGMDFIITRDSAAFSRSTVKSMTARQYIEIFH